MMREVIYKTKQNKKVLQIMLDETQKQIASRQHECGVQQPQKSPKLLCL